MIRRLQERFGPLQEESRLTAMTEMLAFTRRPGESVSALLMRYDVVRQRAAAEGEFVMNIQGCSLQLLRALGVPHQQLFFILQPFGGGFPQTEAQFQQMTADLRRWGRIQEGVPGNIAQTLYGPFRQARPGAYYAEGDGEEGTQASGAAVPGNSFRLER